MKELSFENLKRNSHSGNHEKHSKKLLSDIELHSPNLNFNGKYVIHKDDTPTDGHQETANNIAVAHIWTASDIYRI